MNEEFNHLDPTISEEDHQLWLAFTKERLTRLDEGKEVQITGCKLVFGSEDGFPLMEERQGYWNGPDPFSESHTDPPQGENDYDSSYQEQEIDPPYWED